MKLTWRDIITTLLALTGGAVVYAKFYQYSWALIGSWRSAVMALAAVGLAMLLVTGFDTENQSWLNIGEMIFGIIAAGLIITGVFVASSFVFYSLTIILGALYAVSTARHIRHSILHDGTTSSFHHHVPAH